jgi:hypothetical protein
MATVAHVTTNLVDTAIGPVAVSDSLVDGFDVDDLVHSIVRAQAIKLQLIQKVRTADPRLAKNRPPVNLDGNAIGGF